MVRESATSARRGPGRRRTRASGWSVPLRTSYPAGHVAGSGEAMDTKTAKIDNPAACTEYRAPIAVNS